MKRLRSDGTLDRLSELHESLIFLILSFLPMRDVVRTTILSKRWKNLWFTLPCLNFSEDNKNSVDSRNFINRALMLRKGTEIQKLKFSFGKSFDASLFGDMDLWVCFAKERKVEELYIRIPYENRKRMPSNPVYQPPQCLYSCSSIRKLSLVACNLQIRGNVHWHQLKTLQLHGFGFTEAVINQVVSSCPQLEIFELLLLGSHQNLSFRSTSLRVLSIITSKYDYPSVLTICAPNVEVLVISGAPYSECLLLDLSSVTDVTLDFADKWVAMLIETLRQIMTTCHKFYHVEAVTLSACCYKILPNMTARHSFSPLMDVKHLWFRSGPIEPTHIFGLLGIFPKLERLVIDWKLDANQAMLLEYQLNQYFGEAFKFDGEDLSQANMLKSFLMQLKTVEITWYFYEASIFQFIEFLLKHATMIEKIVIKKRGNKVIESEDMLLAAQKVVSLQRSFPTVEMVLCRKC